MRPIYGLLATVLLTVGLAGCFHDDDDDGVAQPTAQLRILHGSPDAPNVDVLINGNPVLTDVPYKAASGYLSVPANGFDAQVNATGTDTTALSLPNVDLVPDTRYTLIAANTLNNIESILLEDTASEPAAGNLQLRVVHAAAAAPTVDIYVTAPDADLTTSTPTVASAAYQDNSGYLEVPAGDYRIRVTPADGTEVLFDSGTISLTAGSRLTTVALPSVHQVSPLDLVALTGDAAAPTLEINDNRAQVRAAHMSPDAPNVDVYIDGIQVLTNVPFQTVSDYLLVDSGTRQLAITPTGNATAVIDTTFDVTALSATTAAAVNFVASIEPLVLQDDLTPPASGNAHLRVVHASPDAPNVDVFVDGNQVLTDVPFKAASDYLQLAAGAHNVQVNATGTATTVIDANIDLVDQGIYTLFAADELASITPVLVRDDTGG